MDFETLQIRLLTRVKNCIRNGELTERGLARMIGISQPHMHHILKGCRNLSLENADRILRRLHWTVLDLLEAPVRSPENPAAIRSSEGVVENEQGELAGMPAGLLDSSVPAQELF